jgi:hypothetical protein
MYYFTMRSVSTFFCICEQDFDQNDFFNHHHNHQGGTSRSGETSRLSEKQGQVNDIAI